MRLNKYIAQATGLSRRAADTAIASGRVSVDGVRPQLGSSVPAGANVTLDGASVAPPLSHTTILLNKPVGYVCSRAGQGSRTVYDLLPPELHHLKPVGRLDKDSSGLLIMTDDGTLAHRLTHPSFEKDKVYELTLDKPLTTNDLKQITQEGVKIDDGRPSRFDLLALNKDNTKWRATLTEGRNRQIRRTLAALGYIVTALHRSHFHPYTIDSLSAGQWRKMS